MMKEKNPRVRLNTVEGRHRVRLGIKYSYDEGGNRRVILNTDEGRHRVKT